MTLLSEDEAEPIHSAILRKEPWTLDAGRRLRAEADKRLHEGPWTVTADRPNGVELDPHEYYSESHPSHSQRWYLPTSRDIL